jgi:multidrug efflux pump subunit AcrB
VICLENTHRHLGLGAKPKEAAFLGASEVAMPELVASCCTLLVLAPLALMPGLGVFLFRPMALAVALAMTASYVLSRCFVPSRCAYWLKPHRPHPDDIHSRDYEHRREHEHEGKYLFARLFAQWEGVINLGIAAYVALLERVMRRRKLVVASAFALLVVVVVGLGSQLRREFFPEVDAGAFEVYVRAPSGTRIEVTERKVADVEKRIKETLGGDLELVISELGVTPDWSAAYTPNSGPMDAVLKVQLTPERHKSAQEYVRELRQGFATDGHFADLEFAFDAGGMIRGAMNEGKSTPINVRITAKDLPKARKLAEKIRDEVRQIDGVVDCRIIQRLDYPEYVIDVDQAKAAQSGLTQMGVMQNVVAALNSSIQFNKHNFWIDPVSHNQYFVGVQYPEQDISSVETLLDVPITSPRQPKAIPLRNVATVRPATVPAEIAHTNLSPTIDLTMGVQDRDLGHVAADVAAAVAKFGTPTKNRDEWTPFDPTAEGDKPMEGAKVALSGEYQRMQETFRNQALGMVLAVLLIYFLMVALFKSYVTPLVILMAVPFGVVGVIVMLFLTGTAINVQSLLGVIFMVGIVVSNTVLLTDFARHVQVIDRLNPTDAIRKAASIRVRPVVMTATATLFALIPMALGLERGSEANVPLGRAVLGGLIAGLGTTLLVVPCLYSLMVRETPPDEDEEAQPAHA